MRHRFVILVALIAAAPQAALALSPTDTVADWQTASETDRVRAVEDWQRQLHNKGSVSRDDLVDCIDSAAGVGGHETFSIGDIAAACTQQLRSGDGAGHETTL